MKFGVISYEKKMLKLDGRDAQNIGDWLQMFAMKFLFEEWGIADLIHISRNEAALYEGDGCIVPVNGFFTCNDAPHISTKTFPLPRNIEPVFVSFHFHDRYIPPYLKDQLKCHEPIGCRDEETMCNLRRNGISAYITGCVSALLPKREIDVAKRADKILFVDVPDSLVPYIPAEYEQEAEYLNNVYPITRTCGEKRMTEEESVKSYEFAKERYRYYCNNAKLIVTSRLHVAAPAIAMGIPCILASDNFDARYSWIDKFLPLYTPEDFHKIDWDPSTVNYEQEKESIKKALEKMIVEKTDKENPLQEINRFYENRKRGVYNSAYKNALNKYKYLPYNTKYAIWGTVTSQSNQLKYCIDEMYPQWEFTGIYDRMAQGNFEGYTIQSSGSMKTDDEILYFIMAKAIYKEARQKLLRGRFILVDVSRDKFEDNLPPDECNYKK